VFKIWFKKINNCNFLETFWLVSWKRQSFTGTDRATLWNVLKTNLIYVRIFGMLSDPLCFETCGVISLELETTNCNSLGLIYIAVFCLLLHLHWSLRTPNALNVGICTTVLRSQVYGCTRSVTCGGLISRDNYDNFFKFVLWCLTTLASLPALPHFDCFYQSWKGPIVWHWLAKNAILKQLTNGTKYFSCWRSF